MIAKAKAIAHGKQAIEYAMKESKGSELLESNLVQSDKPKDIYSEFVEVQRYNSRCHNKFIRMEIGIAPQDEHKLSSEDLRQICQEFSEAMGLQNHQWIACTHGDTDNLHIHFIANRIGIDGKVFNTDFISRRVGNIAEEISRKRGLTIANEVKPTSKYQGNIISFERQMAQAKIERVARSVMKQKPKSLNEFSNSMKKEGVNVSPAVNKKGNIYGLRFEIYGETFKASQIGKEFGYHTLLNTCRQNNQEVQQHDNCHTSSESKPISSLFGILPSLNQSTDDYMSNLTEEELKRRKRKKRKRKL